MRGADRRGLLIALATLAVFIATWLFAGATPLAAVGSAIAVPAAGLVFWLMPRRPIAALGVIVLLAPLGILQVPTPVGQMRIEQPAVAALLLACLVYRRQIEWPPLRRLLPLVVAAGIYLAALTLSSLLIAPQPVDSLRIVAWTLLSMLAGLATAALSAANPRALVRWFAVSGVILGALGVIASVAFYLIGPSTYLRGIVGGQLELPKVMVFAQEPNLYAIYVAALVPLVAERYRARPGVATAIALAIVAGAIGVGITRSAYLGLLVALPIYAWIGWQTLAERRLLLRTGAICLAALVAGMIVAPVLLDRRVRDRHLAERPPSGATATPTPDPADYELEPNLQTLDFRLDRIPPALEDIADGLPASALIGLGSYSFGQRHEYHDGPDHMAILGVAVPYESGLIGSVALAALFGILGLRLWRVRSDESDRLLAAAYGGSVLVLLIAYQATNALHFTFTWLFVGAALGVTLNAARREEPAAG